LGGKIGAMGSGGGGVMKKIRQYTVEVTKTDGAKSQYFVAALIAGGAEVTALREVYQALYAHAVDGWPIGVTQPDLISNGAAIAAVQATIDGQ
jgi:hypothetical protein